MVVGPGRAARRRRLRPLPDAGQGTSLALIGAYLLANRLAQVADLDTALRLWENDFRPNVEENQRLATHGMAVLVPASRPAIFARNQTMRMISVFARFGWGLTAASNGRPGR